MRRIVPWLAATALLAGCGSTTVDLSAPIRLGAIWSLTGAAGAYGASQQAGADLAIAQINAAGGVHRRNLALIVRDDASSGPAARAAMLELRQFGVVAVLGPTLSSSALVADPAAQERGLPVLAVSNTADGIVEMGDFIFRCSLPERTVVANTVAVTHARLGYTRAALIHDAGDAFAQTSAAAFTASLAAQGVTLTTTQTFATGTTDFSAPLAAIAATAPDVVCVAALAGDSVRILQQGRTALGPAVVFLGGNGFNTARIAAEAGAAAEGAISGAAWHPSLATPGNAAFVNSFNAANGHAPDQFAAQAYVGVRLLAQALQAAADPYDRAAVRDALAAIRGEATLLGTFDFTPERNPSHPPVVQVVRDGSFELY